MEITQEQYQLIAETFPKPRGNVKVSNRQALNGILYILEHGCKTAHSGEPMSAPSAVDGIGGPELQPSVIPTVSACHDQPLHGEGDFVSDFGFGGVVPGVGDVGVYFLVEVVVDGGSVFGGVEPSTGIGFEGDPFGW